MSLQELATKIAEALGSDWKRSTRFDADDSGWRAELEGPANQRLFLSNTWASKGRLYISGDVPQNAQIPYGEVRPSITVASTKSSQQIANDITRRLLPEYLPFLEKVLDSKAKSDAFKAGREALAAQVAVVVGGRVQGEMVYSGGWDLQVSSPDSIRINGNCNYITLEQLKKIKAACPELFAGKDSE